MESIKSYGFGILLININDCQFILRLYRHDYIVRISTDWRTVQIKNKMRRFSLSFVFNGVSTIK